MGPLMGMKFKPVLLARALAMRVLPVPEGPVNKIPREGDSRPAANSSGYLEGQSTTAMRAVLISWSPPRPPI